MSVLAEKFIYFRYESTNYLAGGYSRGENKFLRKSIFLKIMNLLNQNIFPLNIIYLHIFPRLVLLTFSAAVMVLTS